MGSNFISLDKFRVYFLKSTILQSIDFISQQMKGRITNCKNIFHNKKHYNLKDELKTINEMIKKGKIDIDKIEIPSFKYFIEKLHRLL